MESPMTSRSRTRVLQVTRRAAACLVPLLAGLLVIAGLPAVSQALMPAGPVSYLHGKRIYTSPDAPPLEDGVVLIQDGRILAVGKRDEVPVPDHATSSCNPGVIVAGFQNSHVHFTEPQFSGARDRDGAVLSASIERMLTRYGFTTVVDTASDGVNTVALRERIWRGQVIGPRILTAGLALYPHNGIPFYLRDLPPEFLARLPQPASAEEAVASVRANLDRGADLTKLFVATPQTGGKVAYMVAEVARAAADETHRRKRLVYAHPTNLQGIRLAMASGVNVLAHTTIEDIPSVWDAALIQDLIEHDVALVPTLRLWRYEMSKVKLPEKIIGLATSDAIEQLRAFSAAGGQVLFGTDVGYMAEYDPSDEYALMALALTPMQILESLTVSPAARWQEAERRGRIAPGMDADLVVLKADPASDPRNFARVACTLRQGTVLFPADTSNGQR